MQLIKPDSNFDLIGKRRPAAIVSAIAVIASLLAFFFIEPNWGIDFTGGTEIHLKFDHQTDISEIRSALAEIGLSDDAVQQVNAPDDNEYVVRIQEATFGAESLEDSVNEALATTFGADWVVESRFDAQVGAQVTIEHAPPAVPLALITESLQGLDGAKVEASPDDRTFYVKFPGLPSQVQSMIGEAIGDSSFEVLQLDSVGPKVGGDLRRQGFISMAATLGLILIYVAFRFDLVFAPGAVLALFHDVAITLGIFTVMHREVNLPMIGALLTIIGYSLNDTIVIYDRIRENLDKYRRADMPGLVNSSINETLNRTLNTSLTTLVAVAAFLFFGGPVINTFALAMMIGVIVGTYSTIFIASPTILVMEKLKPRLAGLMVPTTRDDEVDRAEAASSNAEKRRLARSQPDPSA